MTEGSGLRQLAQQRSLFYSAIRSFFNERSYVETETPLLSFSLIPESSIEVFQTELVSYAGTAAPLFLTPSPEIYMKELISKGIGDCYQLTKSFRNSEESSGRHLNEFTMLEWYAMDQNYMDNIKTTQALLQTLAPLATEASRPMFTEFVQVSMQELFEEYVNINLTEAATFEQLQRQASDAGFSEFATKSHTWEELFSFIFVSEIETKLPQNKTVFITNYPAQIPTTAKKTGQHYERWEFYMNGWEIANCYTEETRYDEMYALFEGEGALKQKMAVPHPVNFEYLDIFKTDRPGKQPFPQCSGVALGVDRLFAVALNVNCLSKTKLC